MNAHYLLAGQRFQPKRAANCAIKCK